jgi:hypothetical protein
VPSAVGARMSDSRRHETVIPAVRCAVFTDHRFFVHKSRSACQVADYILTQVLQGERDLDLLKASGFKEFSGALSAQLRISASLPTATLDTARRFGIIQ